MRQFKRSPCHRPPIAPASRQNTRELSLTSLLATNPTTHVEIDEAATTKILGSPWFQFGSLRLSLSATRLVIALRLRSVRYPRALAVAAWTRLLMPSMRPLALPSRGLDGFGSVLAVVFASPPNGLLGASDEV